VSFRKEHIAQFDRYLRREMDEQELLAFEERLHQSESLQKALKDYQDVSKELEAGYEYHHYKEKMADIHQRLYSSSAQSRKKGIIFKPGFWITTTVAASIALLLYFNPFGFNGEASADYAQLSNEDNAATEEMEYVAESIEEAADEMGASDNENTLSDSIIPGDGLGYLSDQLPMVYGNPRGTAFQIDNAGHFLTAGHLVEGNEHVQLQLKSLHLSFEVAVIYEDDSLDFAVLQCSPSLIHQLKEIPYQLSDKDVLLGDELFAMGYPKKDIVFTPGNVSSETGFESDPLYYESTLPSNAGHSGSPVFNEAGEICGIVTGQHTKQQAATYILKPEIIQSKIRMLSDSLEIMLPENLVDPPMNRREQIQTYRQFIFELHFK
jgi:S1-C subfamily serine protease